MKNTTALALLLISGGILYAFTNPQYQAVTALRMEAAEYEEILGNISGIDETRNALFTRYESIPENEIARLEKLLPDNPDLVGLAHELDAIAGAHGVVLQSAGLDDASSQLASAIEAGGSGEPYEKAPMAVSFVADYDSFRDVLTDMEESLRLTDIRAISFSVGEGNLYEYEIKLDAYWLK